MSRHAVSLMPAPQERDDDDLSDPYDLVHTAPWTKCAMYRPNPGKISSVSDDRKGDGNGTKRSG
jgi:hypothetical protein